MFMKIETIRAETTGHYTNKIHREEMLIGLSHIVSIDELDIPEILPDAKSRMRIGNCLIYTTHNMEELAERMNQNVPVIFNTRIPGK